MDRRRFLWNFGGGIGGIALSQMLCAETHFPPRAKRVVQLFMSGAASQCDTFDYKPELIRRNGEKFDPGGKVELFQSSPGAVMKSPWEWKPRGQSGKWIRRRSRSGILGRPAPETALSILRKPRKRKHLTFEHRSRGTVV